jgi:transposase
MRKLDFSTLIVETVSELREREKKEKDARLRLRVQLLRLLKSQAAASIKEASQVCGITPKHGYDLWHKYRAQGLDKYVQLSWKPRVSKLSAEQQTELLKRAASANGFGSQREARRYLQNELGVSYTQGGVCLLFQRLRIKAKEPRPLNVKASREEQSAYKKTFSGE